MSEQFLREEPLIGKDGVLKLNNSHVAIFGCGGVGGFVCEALARAGVGHFTIVDNDNVNSSNLNRQIIALSSTIGEAKVMLMKQRILAINPTATVEDKMVFVGPNTINEFLFKDYDYVADCVDNVTAKLLIIEKAKEADTSIISSMGTGNKLDPLRFQIKDISKTAVCPLAKVIRLELRKRNIKNVKVLYSEEEPVKSKDFIASISFVPSVAGLLIAREIVLDLTKKGN